MGYEDLQIGLYDSGFEHDSCGVGFVCQVKGQKSHEIVKQGLSVLKRLSHRGAVGADPKTGDGAGILIQIPHEFFAAQFDLPHLGNYGTGLVFLPQNLKNRKLCKELFAKKTKKSGLKLLGWRKVPVNSAVIGKTAQKTQPAIEQVFVKGGGVEFEKQLYYLRRDIEREIKPAGFYIVSLSSRTFIYKGLLMPQQVEDFFLDLKDKRLKSALALVHSRYSTNTFPAWDLAQPFRFLAHNGEINTLRGNLNWMKARGIDCILPGGSDSASLDNVFELLVLEGRSLAQVMMLLIPQAWEKNTLMSKRLKDFYLYHACFMEPWDGPAAIAFTDGTSVGAVLDRNGLRPARYLVTKDDLVVMASEVGVLEIAPENILYSGRLEPGKIFYIDTRQGKIINDEEIKAEISSLHPYADWLEKNLLELDALPAYPGLYPRNRQLQQDFKIYGYTREDFKYILKPMAEQGKEPIGSMGSDTPHAILSRRPQLLYNYFKQLFAQVTNPAIDPIREELVMSLESFIGPQQNIFEETPGHCHKLYVKDPILTNENLEKIRQINQSGFKTETISINVSAVKALGFGAALKQIFKQAEQAIKAGYTFIILSDKDRTAHQLPLPALLAVSGLHHYLIRKELRTRVGLILESGEPREVHHFALLFGYGADLVNPYLAYAAIELLAAEKELTLEAKAAVANYRNAVDLGLLKIFSKMGISTLNSYRGAQIFEALGISQSLIDKYFTSTVSRIGGIDLKIIEKETKLRSAQSNPGSILPAGGIYQWKKDGEHHLWNPETISALQAAVRTNDYQKYQEFARVINQQEQQPVTLRGLLKFAGAKPIPLTKVEPLKSIVRRFAAGAMSFGSISGPIHETIAVALNRLKGKSNTGEGGEDPARFLPLPNGDSKRSAVKQIASGRFGVTANYLVNADEIQIKIAQGAKPGEGGQLPGHKVSTIIARTRYTTPGVTLISPPPHHDIYSIEDLAQLIFDLKNVNPRARISVKLVSEVGVGTVAAGVAKGHADMILISGGDGGTGASPLSSIRHAGLPWELGLSETHQTLVLNDLRDRVRLQTDGQMRTGRDLAIAALLGAEEFGFGTAVLVVSGCVMLRHCHLNNCSLGVATQDELLTKRFCGRPEYIENYFRFVAEELREIMAQLGFKTLDEMIGRNDLLKVNSKILPWKAGGIDYTRILYQPEKKNIYCTQKQKHAISKVLDKKLIALAKPAWRGKYNLTIQNTNRTTGAMLSGEVVKRFGEGGLPEDSLHFKFKGVAGQSFGAWLARGITLELEGLANDYVGKGISGGKIIIYPGREVSYQPEKNIILGNTTFYGAIAGEAYIRGIAGERFCIRNSGLYAVVEGVGDHACEYMTGGRVVILGETGRNFGAGMSGGIAYVYDQNGDFAEKCNQSLVKLLSLAADDQALLLRLLHQHQQYTGSLLARKILADFPAERKKFIKILPTEYARILQRSESDLTEVS